MKRYIVLSDDDYEVLSQMVCDRIAKGYVPCGGVAVLGDNGDEGLEGWTVMQAMWIPSPRDPDLGAGEIT